MTVGIEFMFLIELEGRGGWGFPGRATELLVASIVEGASRLAAERGSKTLTQAHM
jgi:hypothetical protein